MTEASGFGSIFPGEHSSGSIKQTGWRPLLITPNFAEYLGGHLRQRSSVARSSTAE